jgi:hypothetical protein
VTFTTLDVPGASFTVANGINARGWIVGTFEDATAFHGFLATPEVIADPTSPVIPVSTSPATLSPPNGQPTTVTVSGTMTDDPRDSMVQAGSAAYRVMEESGQIQPSGRVTPQADASDVFTVALQASRNEADRDGRQYLIALSATDNAGNRGSASATATVPHHSGR